MSAALATPAVLAAAVVLCRPAAGRRGGPTPGARPRRSTAGDGGDGGRGACLPDVVLIDLVVAALAAGLPAAAAVAAARSAAQHSPDDPVRGPAHQVPAAVTRAFRLAERTGASAAELLRRAADDERSRRRAAVAVAASRLGVRLVVPLGLTILPAFVLLGVAPVVIGLAQQLLAG